MRTLVIAGERRPLGESSDSWLAFGEEPQQPGAWAGRRLLSVRGKPAFELSFWCGTCQFISRRLEGANEGGSIEDLQQLLTEGVSGVDEVVVERFGSILPADDYIPLLLSIQPRLVLPAQPGGYFAEEQVATWGVNSFWGLPEYPRTPYYRTFDTVIDAQSHLFEFVVPMVPPTWNERVRVAELTERLAESSKPTAVAVSILDVCQPADSHGGDYYAHWALTHLLLDGHHKMEAAAASGRPLQLLSLLGRLCPGADVLR